MTTPAETVSHTHSHENGGISHSHSHSHDAFGGHGHSHEILDGPGSFLHREKPLSQQDGRDWKDRAFTIGIGGWEISFHLIYLSKPFITYIHTCLSYTIHRHCHCHTKK